MTDYEFYKEHPKTCARDDFLGQVKRTVNGKPVSQVQIDMIVEVVAVGLELAGEDWLLDLCCGNGFLSRRFFRLCSGGVGVDYSEFLVDVAREYFQHPPRETYLLEDVVDYVRNEPETAPFTKAVCYGSFQYLSLQAARDLLILLRKRFPGVRRFFIGNLPDKALMEEFYREREYRPGLEDDHRSMIGIWRTREEFSRLAGECGWDASFSKMPESFYAAHYRYDAVLTPVAKAEE